VFKASEYAKHVSYVYFVFPHPVITMPMFLTGYMVLSACTRVALLGLSVRADASPQAFFHMPSDTDISTPLLSPKAAAAAERQEGSEMVMPEQPTSSLSVRN
jgi:hypothetical protein